MTAVAASWLMSLIAGSRVGWASPLQIFGMQIAGTFLVSALGTSYLMPRASTASRVEPGAPRSSPVVMLMLGVLAIAAVGQIASLTAWWAEDSRLLIQAIGSDRDPTGLSLIPAVILFSLPTIAGLAIVTFLLTSLVGMLVRVEITFALLAGCVFLQAGLVIGEQFLLRAMAELGATVLDAIRQSPDAKATAQVTDFLARHGAAAGALCQRLVWILGGYAVTAAVSGVLTQRRPRSLEPLRVSTPDADVQVPEAFAAPRTLATAPATPTTVSAFPHSLYSVRPRQTFLDFFLRQYSTYDITSVPPSTQSRFSFTWTTSVLRREPSGPDLMALTRGDRHGMLGRRDHRVTDVTDGAVVGVLRTATAGWEIVDQAGTTVGSIAEEKSGVGFIAYVATVHGEPACRFTWAMQGMSVLSSGLDVEFLETAGPGLDRRFAIAIAPILEHKARRANQYRT